MNWFRSPTTQEWFSVGRTSRFPNLGVDEDIGNLTQSCKAFHAPPEDKTKFKEVEVQNGDSDDEDIAKLHEQVIVFQHKGKFHAIDHVRLSEPMKNMKKN